MNTLTGIPIDAFLAVLGALGGIIYGDVIRRINSYHRQNQAQIRSLHKDNRKRAQIQLHMQSYQRLICDKLGVAYQDPPPDNDDEFQDGDDNGGAL